MSSLTRNKNIWVLSLWMHVEFHSIIFFWWHRLQRLTRRRSTDNVSPSILNFFWWMEFGLEGSLKGKRHRILSLSLWTERLVLSTCFSLGLWILQDHISLLLNKENAKMGLCCCRQKQEILTYEKFVDFSLSSEYHATHGGLHFQNHSHGSCSIMCIDLMFRANIIFINVHQINI